MTTRKRALTVRLYITGSSGDNVVVNEVEPVLTNVRKSSSDTHAPGWGLIEIKEERRSLLGHHYRRQCLLVIENQHSLIVESLKEVAILIRRQGSRKI